MKSMSEIGPREAAQALRIRLDAVYSLIWAGKLPAVKREGRWFIPKSAIEDRLKAREARNV